MGRELFENMISSAPSHLQAIFDRQIELQMDLDDMKQDLISSKAAAARAMWQEEHARLQVAPFTLIVFFTGRFFGRLTVGHGDGGVWLGCVYLLRQLSH
jgi:hypothetical protein